MRRNCSGFRGMVSSMRARRVSWPVTSMRASITSLSVIIPTSRFPRSTGKSGDVMLAEQPRGFLDVGFRRNRDDRGGHVVRDGALERRERAARARGGRENVPLGYDPDKLARLHDGKMSHVVLRHQITGVTQAGFGGHSDGSPAHAGRNLHVSPQSCGEIASYARVRGGRKCNWTQRVRFHLHSVLILLTSDSRSFHRVIHKRGTGVPQAWHSPPLASRRYFSHAPVTLQ